MSGDVVNQRKPCVRPNQLEILLEKAKEENYENLFINYENLEEIPRDVLEINSIQGLFLKRNLLQSLPPDLCKLKLLKTLYLPSNRLSSLPEEIGKCENLESLNVDNNFLKSLPKTIGELKKLKTLQVSNNELEVIPPEIGEVKSLEVLELMKNRIKYLPEELSNCTKLRMLFVGANLIQELPTALLGLHNLEDLSLSRNAIHHLPHDLDKLSQLKSFVLDNNKNLTVIPAAVFAILRLHTLGIHGCGTCNLGWKCPEILEQYLKSKCLKNLLGNIVSLFELCLRACQYIDIKNGSRELLPKSLCKILQSPKGHCNHCGESYFINALLHLSDSSDTHALTQMNDSLYSQIRETKCYFVWCFCSHNCLTKYNILLRD